MAALTLGVMIGFVLGVVVAAVFIWAVDYYSFPQIDK